MCNDFVMFDSTLGVIVTLRDDDIAPPRDN